MSERPCVVFDLDGTLIDSVLGMQMALSRTLVELGGRPISMIETIPCIGSGSRHLVERALHRTGARVAAGPDVDRAVASYRSHYLETIVASLRAYPGAVDLVTSLHADGVALGICTNKDEQLARSCLALLGIDHCFGGIVGGDTFEASKPSPIPLVGCIAIAGAAIDQTVLVGDSAVDVALARAAGIPVILTSHGYATEPLDALGADEIVAGMSDVPAALERVRRLRLDGLRHA